MAFDLSSKVSILPHFKSNRDLMEDFCKELQSRVEFSSGTTIPSFIIFRPQGRPRDEFAESVAEHIMTYGERNYVLVIALSQRSKEIDKIVPERFRGNFTKVVQIILKSGKLQSVKENDETFEEISSVLHDTFYMQRKNKVPRNDPIETATGGQSRQYDELRRLNQDPVLFCYWNGSLISLDSSELEREYGSKLREHIKKQFERKSVPKDISLLLSLLPCLGMAREKGKSYDLEKKLKAVLLGLRSDKDITEVDHQEVLHICMDRYEEIKTLLEDEFGTDITDIVKRLNEENAKLTRKMFHANFLSSCTIL